MILANNAALILSVSVVFGGCTGIMCVLLHCVMLNGWIILLQVVGIVNITTLNNRQYCVIVDPVGDDGKPQLGQKKLIKGEKSFFLRPGEKLEKGTQNVFVMGEDEGLILKANETFTDEDHVRLTFILIHSYSYTHTHILILIHSYSYIHIHLTFSYSHFHAYSHTLILILSFPYSHSHNIPFSHTHNNNNYYI